MVEVYDSSVHAIRLMADSKAKNLIRYNGIRTNEKGEIVEGRYIEASKVEPTEATGEEIKVIDEINNKEYTRPFGKVAPKKVKKEVEKVVEKTKEKEVEYTPVEDVEQKEKATLEAEKTEEPIKKEDSKKPKKAATKKSAKKKTTAK